MWLGASMLDRGVDVNAQADGFIAVNMAGTMINLKLSDSHCARRGA
jgi:hypothetical protein